MDLISEDFCEGVTSESKTFHFVFRTDCHLSDGVVIEGLLTERIAFVELSHFLVTLPHCHVALGRRVNVVDYLLACGTYFLDDVEG